ncbi:MAG: protein kinase, partial [Legionellaceae bacterium]|nr:protein kinase [Legionellaceae bacterium]
SKNFILKHTTSQNEYFLKLEDRLGMPRQAEHHLRANGLADVLTPILIERKVAFTTPPKSETVIRRLVVTTVCKGDSLEKASEKKVKDEARINTAIDVYQQMARVLTHIEANGCVFTDMKNSNWLLDESGQIKIADTKSFFFTNKSGQLDIDDIERKNGNYQHVPNTPFMNPDEMFLRNPRPSAEKLHAYMLGKNLYQYLTGCDATYFFVNPYSHFSPIKRVGQLSFSADIFKHGQGRDLAHLIQSLMDPIPENRPSVKDAYQALRVIEQNSPAKLAERHELWRGCLTLMEDLKALSRGKYGQVSHEVANAIQTFERRADEDSSIEGLEAIQHDLQQLITHFEDIQKIKLLQADCLSVVMHIGAFKFKARDVEDVEMDAFITSMNRRIWRAETLDDLEALMTELQDTLSLVEQNQVICAEMKALTQQNKYGMAEKGKRIAEAFVRVPLHERGRILEVREGGSEVTEAVLKEMASSRLLPRFLHFIREGKGGRLDSEKAATMFNKFKEKHRDWIARDGIDDAASEDEVDTPTKQ